MADEIKAKRELFQGHHLLVEVCTQAGEFEKALDHHEQIYAIKDPIFGEGANHKLKNPKFIHRMETAKKEVEIYKTG